MIVRKSRNGSPPPLTLVHVGVSTAAHCIVITHYVMYEFLKALDTYQNEKATLLLNFNFLLKETLCL